jgi:phospholipid transport system substrate-binding protein
MRHVSRRALLATALLSAVSFASPAQADAGAEAFVNDVGNKVLAAARDGSVPSFRKLLNANADLDAIAIFSLGQYRKNLQPSQKAEYVGLVEDYIARVFSQNAQRLAGQSLNVVASQSAADSVIVKSDLRYDTGHTTSVTWRLIKRGSSYKIFDVNVDGIWLATTQKTNFVSVLKQNKGDMNALIAYLKQ